MFSDQPIFEFRGPFGVPVQIGSSIIFLFLLFLSFGATPEDLPYTLAFVAILIGSIFLHEIGHAWGCVVQRVPVRRVMLYGGGGFCEHAHATRYQDELIVAMGPIVNVVLWIGAEYMAEQMQPGILAWGLYVLSDVNFFLAIFNMLPVMPLDGGRLFNLLMCRLIPPPLAMRVSGAVGLLVGILWVPLMIWAFLTYGFVLLFFPPIRMHWEMLRAA